MSTEWQPIETAPKDGSFVLVYSCGWFPDTQDADIAAVISGRWVTLENNDFMRPTHWMPLPPPPKAQE